MPADEMQERRRDAPVQRHAQAPHPRPGRFGIPGNAFMSWLTWTGIALLSLATAGAAWAAWAAYGAIVGLN